MRPREHSRQHKSGRDRAEAWVAETFDGAVVGRYDAAEVQRQLTEDCTCEDLDYGLALYDGTLVLFVVHGDDCPLANPVEP